MSNKGDSLQSDFREEGVSCQVNFTGYVYEALKYKVKLGDGSLHYREIVKHNGGAVIAAEDDNGKFYVVRQYRFAAGMELLEFPAGKLEVGEEPLTCAERELEEECGCIADDITDLGYILPTPGYSTEKIYLFYAKKLRSSKQNLDEGEFLTCETMTLEELNTLALQGKIHDAKTLVLLAKINMLKKLEA